jgi:hypothetical protein
MNTKRCSTCEEVRSLDRFQKDSGKMKRLGDGKVYHRTTCKDCANQRLRKRRDAERMQTQLSNAVDRPARLVSFESRMTEKELQRRLRAVEGMGY